jgi:hypothetical protein
MKHYIVTGSTFPISLTKGLELMFIKFRFKNNSIKQFFYINSFIIDFLTNDHHLMIDVNQVKTR